jgi:hypothetical protein
MSNLYFRRYLSDSAAWPVFNRNLRQFQLAEILHIPFYGFALIFLYLTGYEKFLKSAQPEFIRDNPTPLPKPAHPAKVLATSCGSCTPNPSSACRKRRLALA